jgi:WD40 repeat protein
MLYEALSGEHPFQANSFQELMARVTLANPKRLRSLNPEVSTDLEAICAKALAGEIDSRYADGTALAEDLDAYLAGERPLAAGDRPAVHRGVILLGSLIAIAVAVAMFAPTHPPAAAPPVARGTVERTNDPETRDPPLDAASEQEGDAAWREIRGVEDPQERMAQAHAWCESFPNHSGLTRAKAFLEREHYTHPTRVLKHAEGLRVLPSFRPDGSLDTLGLDKRHLIWDPRRGKVIRRWTVPHLQWSRREPGRVFIAVRLPDGLVFSGERLPLYRLRRGRATDVESGVRGARALAVSPNGALLAVGRRNQSVTIYDTVTGEAGRSFPFKASRATSLCFTGDGKRLWVFGGLEQDVFDGGLKDAHCFDLASGKRVVARTTKGYISASVFGPDLIVGPQEGSVQVWDAQGNSVGLFRDGQWDLAGPVQDLAVSLDQTVLYVLRNKGSDAASEHQIALWNVATREPIRPPIVRPGPMTALSLSPDGRSLAVGTESGRVEIWEFPTLAPPSEREFESKAPFRRKSRVGPRATISASPSTVLVKGPTGKGSTTLTWDTSGFPGKVRPSVWVFRSKLDQGRRVARDFGDTRLIPWILADEVYTFRVFVGPTPSGELLATTVVRGKLAPRSSE